MYSVQVFLARLAIFGQLGLISDPVMVSKFFNGLHGLKGQEKIICNIVKDMDTCYCNHI